MDVNMKLKLCYLDGGLRFDGTKVLHPVGIVSETSEQERYQLYLGGALGSVARYPGNCDSVLALIAAAQRREPGPFEYDADDVQLTITAEKVQVDVADNQDWTGKAEGRIDTEVWRRALEGKRQSFALPEALDTVVELDFPSL
jgi:hypothetical protein